MLVLALPLYENTYSDGDGQRLKVSSNRLEKKGFEFVTSGLQCKLFFFIPTYPLQWKKLRNSVLYFEKTTLWFAYKVRTVTAFQVFRLPLSSACLIDKSTRITSMPIFIYINFETPASDSKLFFMLHIIYKCLRSHDMVLDDFLLDSL